MATAVQVLQEAEPVYRYPGVWKHNSGAEESYSANGLGYVDKNTITVNFGGDTAINRRRCAAIGFKLSAFTDTV